MPLPAVQSMIAQSTTSGGGASGKSSNGRRAAGVDGRRTSVRATSTATDDRQGSDGASVTSAAAEIREREHPFWRVVAPILAIVCCLVLFSVFTKYFSVDCSNYFMLKLVYPLFFGAAGAVLGGAVSVSGQFKILGSSVDDASGRRSRRRCDRFRHQHLRRAEMRRGDDPAEAGAAYHKHPDEPAEFQRPEIQNILSNCSPMPTTSSKMHSPAPTS